MEGKREITKHLLGESFRDLMLTHAFEKITIKMITDGAGVIRPTFYNYFQDKYELLEWYFKENVMRNVNELLEDSMEKEALKVVFIRFEKNRKFYRKAFEITGQNSFEEILNKEMYEMFIRIVNKYKLKKVPNLKILTKEIICKYYAVAVTNAIKDWITHEDENISAEEMIEAFTFLISNSILDIIDKRE